MYRWHHPLIDGTHYGNMTTQDQMVYKEHKAAAAAANTSNANTNTTAGTTTMAATNNDEVVKRLLWLHRWTSLRW
jgi:hypothetical protein